jgi:SacI homology domain
VCAYTPTQEISADTDLDCLNRSDYDHLHGLEPDPYPGETFTSDDIDYGGGYDQSDSTAEHPFHALRKLLSNGNFYYSCDFDLTSRLQKRSALIMGRD